MNTESQVLNVPIEDIIPNRFQPRISFDESSLQELAASIKAHGIIQPLVLRRLGDKFEIIAGERRYRASKIAGLASVPAVISNIDDKESAEVAIVENVQRRNLSPIEEAKSYKALLDKGYLTQEELANKMGLSQSAISNKLRLLTLSNEVQKALMDGKISERHARSLLQLETHEEQNNWLETIIKERLTVRALDNRLKGLAKGKEEEVSMDNTEVYEQIKNTAEDIISPQVETEDVLPITPSEVKKMPNKFFNFLEDEAVNMNVFDTEDVRTVENTQPMETEEIEMLDFNPTDNVVEEKTSSFNEVEDMINKLVNDLKEKNYLVNIIKDNLDNKISFKIDVEENK